MEENDIDSLVKHTFKAQVVLAGQALITNPHTMLSFGSRHFVTLQFYLKGLVNQLTVRDLTVNMLEFIQEVKKECYDQKNVVDESPMKLGEPSKAWVNGELGGRSLMVISPR